MKKPQLLLISATGVLLSIILPLTLSTESSHERLSLIADMVAAVTSLITLLIAVAIYNSFGVEARLLDKQFDAIASLLATLKGIDLMFRGPHYLVRLGGLHEHSEAGLERFGSDIVGVNRELTDKLEKLSAHTADIYLPPEIAAKIRIVEPTILQQTPEFESLKSRIAWISGTETGEFECDSLNGRRFTIREFAVAWQEIVKSAEQWIRDHSQMEAPLNIPRSAKKH